MFFQKKLDQEIINGIKTIFIQMYAEYNNKYDVSMNENDVIGSCSISVINMNNSNTINKFMFFPDYDGKLGSISIYGSGLNNHFEAIDQSRNCFGFKVSEVTLETTNTLDPFVDISIDQKNK